MLEDKPGNFVRKGWILTCAKGTIVQFSVESTVLLTLKLLEVSRLGRVQEDGLGLEADSPVTAYAGASQ